MAEKKDTRSRKWQITINNPTEKNMTHDEIIKIVDSFSSVCYWCMCDETGENGTYHTHIYIALNEASRFSTIKGKFQGAHFEMAKGTSQQNRDYVTKTGKWEVDKKKETNHAETFQEFGSMPIERQGQRNDIHDLYDMIKQGMTNYQILEENPDFMLKIEKIERARQIVREEQYKNEYRKIRTTYIYGDTGTGKTRTIMETYGYANVYRVTDYDHPFDSYQGQDVILFEEFRSCLKISDMLSYLDGYPIQLPCRYNNKQACFTKVYILSNESLDKQFVGTQHEYPDTWQAFLRRISEIHYYKQLEESVDVKIYTVKEYFYKFRSIDFSPFCKQA